MAKRNHPDDVADNEAPSEDGLVAMRKGDESLSVHPSCVDEHKHLGWVEV